MKFWLAFGLTVLMAVVLVWGVVRAVHGDFWVLGLSLAGLVGLFYYGGQAH